MAMAFTYNSPPRVQQHHHQQQQQQQLLLLQINPISRHSFPVILSFPSSRTTALFPRIRALRTGSDGDKLRNRDVYGGDLLRKPVVQPPAAAEPVDFQARDFARIPDDDDNDEEENEGKRRRYKDREEEEGWVDWEDKILEDTVPLVGFVRMILHSGKYESGARLSPEHEKFIIERLLQHHPEREKKIGCGIDYITIGYHPEFEGSRCLFIVHKDGELIDFSYWKCIKGLIRKNYPLYADSFILRHFRRRRRT